jgi:hypothetical protein
VSNELRTLKTTVAWVKLPADSFIARNPIRDYNTALPDGAWRSPASALAWGARSPGFKSRRPDCFLPLGAQEPRISNYAPNGSQNGGNQLNKGRIARLLSSKVDPEVKK